MDAISQDMIIAEQRDERSTGDSLATAMNDIQGKLGLGGLAKWEGGVVNNISDPRRIFDNLRRRGPFITALTTPGSDLHMVVVDGLDADGLVVVRDPYEGTTYKMTWPEFEGVWQGMSVWRTRRI